MKITDIINFQVVSHFWQATIYPNFILLKKKKLLKNIYPYFIKKYISENKYIPEFIKFIY